MSSGPGAPEYTAWNDALAARFFSPEFAERQVFLYVTDDVINEVGRPLGGGVDEFLAAVHAGPPGATRHGHCQRALRVMHGWRDQGLAYPPYIAYLALFVLAGGHEGNFAPHAYYPRLWELLDERGSGAPPSFDRMIELWDDLERWSTQDRHGDMGVFQARFVGNWIHVGLPLAQTVLTEEERAALPRVFAEAGLDADMTPTALVLQRALALRGRPYLRPRTMTALERGADPFKQALLDVVAEDFIAWDGHVPASSSDHGERHTQVGLRLCLAVDAVAGIACATLRCHAKVGLPEWGLTLASPSRPLRAAECIPGWSLPLTDALTDAEFMPPPATWSSGLTLSDTSRGWRARLRPTPLRMFVLGASFGLPGLIEVPNLPRESFYLAFREADAAMLREWAASDCTDWSELPIGSGLPAGWLLASVAKARTDRGPRTLDPAAAFPDRVSARLVGGIRASAAGNSFFAFAPPQLRVDGLGPNDSVWCNGNRLGPGAGSASTFALPTHIPLDTRITIEVRRGDDVLRRQSLYLVSGFAWRREPPEPGTTTGAFARVPAEPFTYDLLRTPGLSVGANNVYFIGSAAGAVVTWPDEESPPWEPVWAVPFGDRGRAVYCGTSLLASKPDKGRVGSRKQVDLWRKVLWQWRRRITPPSEQPFKDLWKRYREVARDTGSG